MVAQGSPDKESLRLELQEAIITIRHWSSLLIQTAAFVTAADALLISYGFAQKLAAILLLASALPISILLVYLIVRTMVNPLVSLTLKIERRLLIRKDSLGAAFLGGTLQSGNPDFGNVEDLDDEEVRNLDFSRRRRGWLWRPIPVILYAATAAQIGLFVLALAIFNYRFM